MKTKVANDIKSLFEQTREIKIWINFNILCKLVLS